MSIVLALRDAQNNCVQQAAKCTITIDGGIQFTGRIPASPIITHKTETLFLNRVDEGFDTVKIAHVIAVSSHR